ncbi:UNVERIFIED_CONTAM: hypothetical protein Sradi_5424200 [Sesamum radiatum]|uniref:Endonuclease/exonuclease/phosphatase domain-containing protein n=1 Tax=Sesamum radiatum TaxID=300843 RepID=A0AAW2LAV0_SESRA
MNLLQEAEVFDLLSPFEEFLFRLTLLQELVVFDLLSSLEDFSNLIPETEDVVLAPSGEGIIQTDTEDVARRMARHRQGRSMGDEPEAHSASPDQGKIWLFWGLDVRCQVLVNHEQLLHIRLESNKWPKSLFMTAVYAKCDTVERRALWDVLRGVLVGALPWIVSGDFNTVLSPEECLGSSVPSSIVMSNFHDAIADSALVNVGHIGSSYTWYSRRLQQHLDRVLVSGCGMTIFPKMQVTHLELSQLDHCGLLVEAECTVEWKVSSFRFQHMWTMHFEFLRVVRRNWQYLMAANASDREPVFPDEMDSEILEDGLTDEYRWFLCVMPILEEIRDAVFSIDPDSVAGPNGLGRSFFTLVGMSSLRMSSVQ